MTHNRPVIPWRLDRPTIPSNLESETGCRPSNQSNLFSRVRTIMGSVLLCVCRYRLDGLDGLDEANSSNTFQPSNLPRSVTDVGRAGSVQAAVQIQRYSPGSPLLGSLSCEYPLGFGRPNRFVMGAGVVDGCGVTA